MNNIRECIDSGLSGMKLDTDLFNQIEKRKKSKKSSRHIAYKMKYSVAAGIVCAVLLGTTAVLAAGSFSLFPILVNRQAIPDLEPMEVVSLQTVEGTVTEYGDIEKTYTSMEELEKDLGIKLLDTFYATDKTYTKIFYSKIGDGYNVIDVREYIIGDLTNIREWDSVNSDGITEGNDEWYAWTNGNIYKSPVNMKIEIRSDPSQQELNMEYMGYYKYIETFISEQGYTVNVIKSTTTSETPQIQMVFVANGIRYTLQGRVPVDEMKDIVNSMK